MDVGRMVLALYALFMLVGGIIGYRKSGSKPSLIAGGASAVVLLAAYFVVRSNPVAGYWLGAVTALLLCIVFTLRLSKTGKFMPSGALLVVSLAALILLTRFALGAQGKL